MLRKLSSLQLDASPKSRSLAKRLECLAESGVRANATIIDDDDIEVVPDSEEERRQNLNRTRATASNEIIEISSDDEPAIVRTRPRAPNKNNESKREVPAAEYEDSNMPGAWPGGKSKPVQPHKRKPHSARRVVVSDTESEDEEVVPETQDAWATAFDAPTTQLQVGPSGGASGSAEEAGRKSLSDTQADRLAYGTDNDGTADDDGAILIFDNPLSSRKPKPRQPRQSPSVVHSLGKMRVAASLPTEHIITSGGGEVLTSDRPPLGSLSGVVRQHRGRGPTHPDIPDVFSSPFLGRGKPIKSAPTILTSSTAAPSTSPVSPMDDHIEPQSTASKSPRKSRAAKANTAPRVTKKALEEAELARREQYARELFHELNASVFGNKLPSETALIWNKRMQTTAGKANWKRTELGEMTRIDLAVKVLDCDERIRNTLAHEMCHLACWAINQLPKEAHGAVWQGWARRVERKHPEIHISTKHSYDIAYKYEWKCANDFCGKIYGRHSRSIDPNIVACGKCKGDLIPMFEVRKRQPRTPMVKAAVDSRNAAEWTRDSPTAKPPSVRRTTAAPASVAVPSPLGVNPNVRSIVNDSDDMYESDSDSRSEDSVAPAPKQNVGRMRTVMALSDDDGDEGGYICEVVSDGEETVQSVTKGIEIVDLTKD